MQDYRIKARRVHAKRALPGNVFSVEGQPRLVLVTCGGPFNPRTRHYRDNVVVVAVPVWECPRGVTAQTILLNSLGDGSRLGDALPV